MRKKREKGENWERGKLRKGKIWERGKRESFLKSGKKEVFFKRQAKKGMGEIIWCPKYDFVKIYHQAAYCHQYCLQFLTLLWTWTFQILKFSITIINRFGYNLMFLVDIFDGGYIYFKTSFSWVSTKRTFLKYVWKGTGKANWSLGSDSLRKSLIFQLETTMSLSSPAIIYETRNWYSFINALININNKMYLLIFCINFQKWRIFFSC